MILAKDNLQTVLDVANESLSNYVKHVKTSLTEIWTFCTPSNLFTYGIFTLVLFVFVPQFRDAIMKVFFKEWPDIKE